MSSTLVTKKKKDSGLGSGVQGIGTIAGPLPGPLPHMPRSLVIGLLQGPTGGEGCDERGTPVRSGVEGIETIAAERAIPASQTSQSIRMYTNI